MTQNTTNYFIREKNKRSLKTRSPDLNNSACISPPEEEIGGKTLETNKNWKYGKNKGTGLSVPILLKSTVCFINHALHSSIQAPPPCSTQRWGVNTTITDEVCVRACVCPCVCVSVRVSVCACVRLCVCESMYFEQMQPSPCKMSPVTLNTSDTAASIRSSTGLHKHFYTRSLSEAAKHNKGRFRNSRGH